MNRADTAKLMGVLKAAYPNFYRGMAKPDAEQIIELWTEMFAGDDPYLVGVAVKDLVATHTGFPPDIAAVKNKLRCLRAAVTDEPTDEELWQIFRKGVASGLYSSQEAFNGFPPILQRFAGSPQTLHDLAMMDDKTLDTVYHGQFLKQLPAMKERAEFSSRLSPQLGEALKKTVLSAPPPVTVTEEEWNRRRNAITRQLEEHKCST